MRPYTMRMKPPIDPMIGSSVAVLKEALSTQTTWVKTPLETPLVVSCLPPILDQ